MSARLYAFGISHYCEKARWALDWHGVPFREVGWPPGLHLTLARRAGAPRSSVPILESGGTLVQGSSAIIDWAERQATAAQHPLTPPGDPDLARDIERRADDVIGVHVRRFFYAQILPTQGHLVKPHLLANTSPGHRLVGSLSWPLVRRLMIQAMDTTPAAVPDSRARLEAEFARLDDMLSHGRRFLLGDRFSRVDLTVAALLAPLARPEQAPVYRAMTLPPALEAELTTWRERPLMRWVRELYRDYRQPAAGSSGAGPA